MATLNHAKRWAFTGMAFLTLDFLIVSMDKKHFGCSKLIFAFAVILIQFKRLHAARKALPGKQERPTVLTDGERAKPTQ